MNQPVSQSGEMGQPASNTVDGNRNQDPKGLSCANTKWSPDPWWRLDLKNVVYIQKVGESLISLNRFLVTVEVEHDNICLTYWIQDSKTQDSRFKISYLKNMYLTMSYTNTNEKNKYS